MTLLFVLRPVLEACSVFFALQGWDDFGDGGCLGRTLELRNAVYSKAMTTTNDLNFGGSWNHFFEQGR